MTGYITLRIITLLAGITLLSIAAWATTCHTSCYWLGDHQYCDTSCY